MCRDGEQGEGEIPKLRDPKEFEAYSKHYTDLFIYQARQRLDAIRFFFVGFAVLANIMADGSRNPWERMFIGVGAGIIALVFLRLDFRNAQIVEIDEKPLKALQEYAMRRTGGGDAWRTFERCDHERKRLTSYGHLVWLIYAIAWLGSFMVAWRAFTQIAVIDDFAYRVTIHGLAGIMLLLVGILGSMFRPTTADNPTGLSAFPEEGKIDFTPE